MHLFGRNLDHSNSPVKVSGIPTQFLDVLLLLDVLPHTIAMSGLSRVRTEFCQLAVIPLLAYPPVHANRQSPRHSDLGDFRPRRIVRWKYLLRHFREAAHRHLRRFPQLETVICPRRR